MMPITVVVIGPAPHQNNTETIFLFQILENGDAVIWNMLIRLAKTNRRKGGYEILHYNMW
jgi:hypothetical protein